MSIRTAIVILGVALSSAAPAFAQSPAAAKILFDTSPKAVEYQLGRLTNAELVQVERKAGEPKYRPVYLALLIRKGLGREYFNEALESLTAIDKTTATRVLIEALPKIRVDDAEAADRLLGVLLGQPAEMLRKERETFVKALEAPGSSLVLRAAYGGMMIADGSAERAWTIATSRAGHLVELLRSVPYISGANGLRAGLFEPIAALLRESQDAAIRSAALLALGSTRQDAGTFRLLAQEVLKGSDPELRAAAIRSLERLPKEAWPAGEIEPLARAIAVAVEKTPPGRRTDSATIEAIQLAERLAAALPDESRRALRRDLRALGVQVVRIEAVPEQMMFDVRWFAVEAGKPVQIVFYNPDAMSHNLLVIRPGSLKEVGTAASTMTPSTDPKAKPYVPDTPLVLEATRLLNWAETERLNFVAPKESGEYPFVCTFPGHWVRMYGVMLVVDNLEVWEAERTPPKDPMTNQPYPSPR